ncbi:L-aspartate oxidase [Limimaricola pyoseonensis]|uniref:L-aspartate oxidase n=1 Tax=Limimaricola pyoseonensis TaxID=521013 RepID=A0A1G7H485_9RHOB|nr:L-aspartate oxidase [Limimaricola pyoseonensis]SDE95226.1 L-aspartate oxidase [Limimaricola pyoseonensis]
MTRLRTERVVIIGAGLGAISAALALAPRPVLMIAPEPPGQGASSAWAQGGVAAAMDAADSAEAHAADTVAAGAGTVDAAIAAMVTAAARDHIHGLTDLGTPFDRDGAGGYVLSREAAHSAARVVRVKGDQAGRRIMDTLVAALDATPSVQVLPGALLTGIETRAGRVTGVRIEAAEGSAPVVVEAPAVLIAGGGSGGLWLHTTNPPRIRGQAIGAAALAGAEIADAEFVQFHPTAIASGEDPLPLATEALRGEGAWLVDRDGRRFMRGLHPDAELAPRDVVARAVFAERQAGRAPALDTRAALGASVTERFPAVAEACARAGIDPVGGTIPVAAAAHYHMGGIATDARGRASLPGLWACGEAASTGLHGANRLASNGLLEALVFARACAEDIAATLGPAPVAPALDIAFAPGGRAADPAAVARLRRVMTDHVAVLRDGKGLRTALAEIAVLESAHDAPAFRTMSATATLVAAAALRRTESRGGHCRTDFPDTDPAQARRSRMTLAEALTIRADCAKETA